MENKALATIPIAEMKELATVMGGKGLFGKTAEELLPLMILAHCSGQNPAAVCLEYDVIKGKPAINSRAALSKFQAAGGSISWTTRTDKEVTAIFTHPQGGKLEVTWTMERAKQAGLTGKDNWRQYPIQMLSARVIAEGVRAVFPACLSGFYTSEEVQDFGPSEPIDVTPKEAAPKAGKKQEKKEKSPTDAVMEKLTALHKKTGEEPLVILDRVTKGKYTTWPALANIPGNHATRIIALIDEELSGKVIEVKAEKATEGKVVEVEVVPVDDAPPPTDDEYNPISPAGTPDIDDSIWN